MATIFRLALSALLFATMIASFPNTARAKLRSGVPYHMVPYNWAIGGGVSATTVGLEICPSTVVLAPETEHGIPVILSNPGIENIFIDEDKDIHIRFNHTLDICTGKRLGPWGHSLRIPPPNVTFIDVYGFGSEKFQAYPFRIKKVNEFYEVTSYRAYGGGRNIVLQTLNIKPVYDNKHHIKSRLSLTPESPYGSPLLFLFLEANPEDVGIKSVV